MNLNHVFSIGYYDTICHSLASYNGSEGGVIVLSIMQTESN